MINKFTEPRYYYDAIKHNIQMHLLAQVSREDGKTLCGPAFVLYLSLVVGCVPRWDQGQMLD